jgi:hypothetical protein
MKKQTTQEIVVKQEVDVYREQMASTEKMITQAIQSGVPVETMERILAMRKELKSEWSKERFDKAMAEFQGECPVIGKSTTARDESKGKDLYRYATLDTIVEQTRELMQKHGFSYSFKTENAPERIKVTCIVKHRDGHSEESTMETSLSTKTQIMSAPQQIAATVTFNKRYAFVNAFGIMTGDDNEAKLKEADPTEVERAKENLTLSNTVAELNARWLCLAKELKANPDIIVFAAQLKSKIKENENSKIKENENL